MQSSNQKQSRLGGPIMKRRDFLRSLSAAGFAAALAPPLLASTSDRIGKVLPRRQLGSTGELVTALGLGGFHIGWTSEELAQKTIEAALEEGVRFFDTAESYGPGISEERYGRYLTPGHRDEIFLMTKTTALDAAQAREHLEGSLRRMKTDRLDLWQIHAISSPDDVEKRLAGGVLKFAMQAREKGLVRHLGFTGHTSPYAHLRMMKEAGEAFAACQFPINPVDMVSGHSFGREVLPKAQAANYGILAMKTLADGRFFAETQVNGTVSWTTKDPIVPGRLTVRDCLFFALSQPIAVVITGAEKPEFLREKSAMLEEFRNLSSDALAELSSKVKAFAEAGEVEYYKAQELRG